MRIELKSLEKDLVCQKISLMSAEDKTLHLEIKETNIESWSELWRFFDAIPSSVQLLYLARNQLDVIPVSELTKAFSYLPDSVVFLDLSENFLGTNPKKLVKILQAIPSSVRVVGLRDNRLKSSQIELLMNIPGTVVGLNLSNNYFKNADLIQICFALPKLVRLNNGRDYFDTEQFLLAQIFPENQRGINFPFFEDHVKTFIEVNEILLNQFKSYFMSRPTALNHLVCGLICEGRIASAVSCQPNAALLLEACSFYLQAGRDPQYRPLTDALLWHIKTMHQYAILENIDVSPELFVENYALFQGRQSIKAELSQVCYANGLELLQSYYNFLAPEDKNARAIIDEAILQFNVESATVQEKIERAILYLKLNIEALPKKSRCGFFTGNVSTGESLIDALIARVKRDAAPVQKL